MKAAVAGWDCTDSIFTLIPENVRLETLGLMDFEAITSGALHAALAFPVFSKLERLGIWQRNGGTTATGVRISSGWFPDLFEHNNAALLGTLAKRQIALGTG